MSNNTPAANDAPERVEVVLDTDLLQALDRHARERGPGVSRAEVLREIIRAWARENGYLPHGEGIRPEELNSANDG